VHCPVNQAWHQEIIPQRTKQRTRQQTELAIQQAVQHMTHHNVPYTHIDPHQFKEYYVSIYSLIEVCVNAETSLIFKKHFTHFYISSFANISIKYQSTEQPNK
jgi:hypothetical protein